MTEQEILNVLSVLERKYKVQVYQNEADRIYRDGQLAAISDVRHYVKEIATIDRVGMF